MRPPNGARALLLLVLLAYRCRANDKPLPHPPVECVAKQHYAPGSLRLVQFSHAPPMGRTDVDPTINGGWRSLYQLRCALDAYAALDAPQISADLSL
jgi:hypothetical protein